jgi:hypothetical protein
LGGAEFLPTNILDMPMTDLKNRYGRSKKPKEPTDIIRGGPDFPLPTTVGTGPTDIIRGGPDLLENRAVMEATLTIRAVKNIGAYQSVKFNDPVTTVVIQRGFSGWITLCTDFKENDEKWFRNEFVKHYQAYTRRNITYGGHLMGLLEDGNRKSGHEDCMPKPVLVDELLKQMGHKN